MWKVIVILACKFINKVSKLLGHEGSVIGGHYALKLDKNILKKIKLEDTRFNKEFNVYSSDEVASRCLVTPAFMERLHTAADFNHRGEALDRGALQTLCNEALIVINRAPNITF